MRVNYRHGTEKKLDVFTNLLNPGDLIIKEYDDERSRLVLEVVTASRGATNEGLSVIYTGTVQTVTGMIPEDLNPGDSWQITVTPTSSRIMTVRRLESGIGFGEREATDAELNNKIYEYFRDLGKPTIPYQEVMNHLINTVEILGPSPTPEQRKAFEKRIRETLKRSRTFRSQGGYIRLLDKRGLDILHEDMAAPRKVHVIKMRRLTRGLELVITAIWPNVVCDYE